MVYSSSAMTAYVNSKGDTFKTVGAQVVWALMGLIAMVVMMRIDYRWLRKVSVPAFIVAIGMLVLVLIPGFGIKVGGSARWLQIGPLPPVHPAEFAKLALVIYLAHWFARRGGRVREFWSGTVTFLVIFAPDPAARPSRAGPGHERGHRDHGGHDVLRGRRQPPPPGHDGRRSAWRPSGRSSSRPSTSSIA